MDMDILINYYYIICGCTKHLSVVQIIQNNGKNIWESDSAQVAKYQSFWRLPQIVGEFEDCKLLIGCEKMNYIIENELQQNKKQREVSFEKET